MSTLTHKNTGGLHHLRLRPSRRLLQLFGLAAAALAVGGVAGYFIGHAVGDNTGKVNSLKAQVAGLQSQAPKIIASARHQAAQELASARQRASASVASAKQQVSGAQAQLNSLHGQISTASGQLAQLNSQINGAKATVAKSTIPGTGTFVVGSDINPGTYKADASSGCYWARLSSLNSNDIIENDNADGPVVVQIQSGDKAFKTDGCADFHRVGP